MEAGNGMPFQLKQLLHMSTSFKTLGKSCKCSSNEIDLSATSKQIPAAPKCLFAMRLNGDCVKSSAFKDTCQEKFRSSTRQWHRNAAFSKIFANIKPEKKPLPSSFFFFAFSLIRPYNFLASPRMRFFAKAALTSYKVKYVRFLTGTFEDGLLVGHRPPSHSTASLASQDPPAPSAAQVGCGEGKRHPAEHPGSPVREHSAERPMNSLITHQAWLPSWLRLVFTKPG